MNCDVHNPLPHTHLARITNNQLPGDDACDGTEDAEGRVLDPSVAKEHVVSLHERHHQDVGNIAFDHCTIQPAKRTVLIDGRPAAIGARAFDLLMALVERRDRLVSKEELFDLVWPGLVVEENNLQVQIWALRKLLGSAVIATIPRRGYRFVAEITGAAEDAGARPAPLAAQTASTSSTRPAR